MSAEIDKYLKCDSYKGCGSITCIETFGKRYNRDGTFKEKRELAEKIGWSHDKGWDFCPACTIVRNS